jgi:AraC-like DNA-binding protein
MLSVKQVMVKVGLADHSHFARDYKREFGESPSETRRHSIELKAKIALGCHKTVSLATTNSLPDHQPRG